MLIALDYDGTYTTDPALWMRFIVDALKSGHKVICATMRSEQEKASMCADLKELVLVICTDRKAKLVTLHEQDIYPDIWIDDNPAWLFNDA